VQFLVTDLLLQHLGLKLLYHLGLIEVVGTELDLPDVLFVIVLDLVEDELDGITSVLLDDCIGDVFTGLCERFG
jgi:hypothetical protein